MGELGFGGVTDQELRGLFCDSSHARAREWECAGEGGDRSIECWRVGKNEDLERTSVEDTNLGKNDGRNVEVLVYSLKVWRKVWRES